MKRLGIALLLVLVALRGAGAAWAFNDDPPLTGPDSIQAPQRRTGRGHRPPLIVPFR